MFGNSSPELLSAGCSSWLHSQFPSQVAVRKLLISGRISPELVYTSVETVPPSGKFLPITAVSRKARQFIPWLSKTMLCVGEYYQGLFIPTIPDLSLRAKDICALQRLGETYIRDNVTGFLVTRQSRRPTRSSKSVSLFGYNLC